MENITMFVKRPEGKCWSGGFGGMTAKINLDKAKELKMLASLKRFAKELCAQYDMNGMTITGIEFQPLTDTQDDYIKI